MRSSASLGNEAFDGVIDDVSIYGVALSAAQVSTHYNQGVPEPASHALLLAAAGAVVGVRRRAQVLLISCATNRAEWRWFTQRSFLCLRQLEP